jgi:hypothetical protein
MTISIEEWKRLKALSQRQSVKLLGVKGSTRGVDPVVLFVPPSPQKPTKTYRLSFSIRCHKCSSLMAWSPMLIYDPRAQLQLESHLPGSIRQSLCTPCSNDRSQLIDVTARVGSDEEI